MKRWTGALGLCLLGAVVASTGTALAYTPGSGTIYSDNFDAALEVDWEVGNNVADSPWTQIADGGDKSFYADGKGQFPTSPTRHWGRHFLHPVDSGSFSLAFEYRAELGPSYLFDLHLQQRGTSLRQYRLRIDGSGILSLWRSEGSAMVQKTSSASGTLPVNQKRWIRVAIEPNGAGQRLRVRVWNGGAGSEPTTWTLTYDDPIRTLERVSRFELIADGPRNIETWIDDLDAFGAGTTGVAGSIHEIYIVELSHLDIGFTEPPDTIEAFAKSHIDEVLQNLAADPAYKWTIEEAWWLDRWWERSSASERQNLVDWLKTGRLSLTAGYASLHTSTAGHEELTRNLYYASKFSAAHQVPLRSWITDDVPGSTFALPELLARSGIDYFVGGMNTPFGGRVTAPNHGTRPFWWVGPDGSKVLSWITFDAYAEAFDWGFSFFDTVADIWRKMGKKLPEQEEAGYPYPELLLMRAFDNHYQGFHTRDLINQWNATYETPKFRLATIEQFMDHMVATYGASSFPSYTGDFGAAWSSSHANAQHTESWVRRAHRDGRAAEALLGTAWAAGGPAVPTSDVDFMYRRMLEVDEHSGAGGWPGYFTPEEMTRNNSIHLGYARDARDKAAELLALGEQRFVANVPASGDAIVVVNPLGRDRDGWVQQVLPPALFNSTFRLVARGTGQELPYEKITASSAILFRATALPSVGYRVFDLLPGAPTVSPTGALSVTTTQLENDFYRITIDPADGSITSLWQKTNGRELVDTASSYRFNRLGASVTNDINAANPPASSPVTSAALSVEQSGPMVVAIKAVRSGTPHVQTVYRLYRGEDRVEIENTLDRSKMPYVPNSIGTRAYYVTLPFNVKNFQLRAETTTRYLDPRTDGFPRSDSFDWYNTEHVLNFWDQTGGVVYAVDSVDSHFFEKLKALGGAQPALGTALLLPRLYDRTDEYQFADNSIGAFQMEPGTPDLLGYTHHLRGVASGFDAAAVSRFGFEALNRPRSVLLSARGGSFPPDSASLVHVDAPNTLPYTVKAAEDGDGLIVRITELTGASQTIAQLRSDVFSFSAALRTEQDEQNGTPLTVAAGIVSVPLGPYETATVRLRIQPLDGPILLLLTKNSSSGTIELQWSGGGPSYTLRRANDPQFTQGVTTLQTGTGTSFSDPVLADGLTYFYRVD